MMYAAKMRLFISIFLILFAVYLNAESVYKTVDENGKVTFTDTPSAKAEKIKIKELDTIKNPNPAEFAPKPQQPAEKVGAYNSFVIANPTDGAAIRSNNGDVSISLLLDPALKPGDKIIVLMDGKEIGSSTSISLQNVDRGTHSINARVVGANGNKLISTSSTFSLLRASK